MHPVIAGAHVFEARIPDVSPPIRYQVRFAFPDGSEWETEDAYRFPPCVGEVDEHLFREGTHLRLWDVLGARPIVLDGVHGTAFSVWAPNARGVSVVGDFCAWDLRRYPMRTMGSSGIFDLFVPGVVESDLYKFAVNGADGVTTLKTDPFARKMEQSPGNASIVVGWSRHAWRDATWMAERRSRDLASEPMLIYEVHLGSWARMPEAGDRALSYREIAPRLIQHVLTLGVTHIEIMPIAEHPYTGSWGYQVTGFYAPTSRYGTSDDLRYLVDECHRAGIGVLLDWVPAHFPKDDFALRRFDGTALYEHEDPRMAEHPDWGTLIFNLARNEVRAFLIANALYWLREFHIDGLRVDAVASMLYLDYSREENEWQRNEHGGRENLAAIAFLRRVNEVVAAECPGCVTIAEESTAWPGVTGAVSDGGLGFTFKWNLGWMHDTLSYFQLDPVHRSFHHDRITFAMLYEHTERFVMPLSHDEVVHEKRSLLSRMPGDEWSRFANLRALLAYMYTRPGKKLVFMGTELAPYGEWDHDASLDWHLASTEAHGRFMEFMRTLGGMYRALSPLWERDYRPGGFEWLDANDRDQSVFSYVRYADAKLVAVILNLTPVPREGYRIGVPRGGLYLAVLNSDESRFGGSGHPAPDQVVADQLQAHGRDHSILLTLPPLSALVLVHSAPED
jgi:1,4-alpha-glucan branching enzyme